MRSLISVIAVTAMMSCYADSVKPHLNAIDQVYENKLGGKVKVPGSARGVIGFVDCASGIERKDMDSVVATLSKDLKFVYKVDMGFKIDQIPTAQNVKATGCDMCVFVVSSKHLPPSLIAIEDGWAVVNVEKLREGLPENVVGNRLFSSRCRAELMRAFLLVAGGWTSQYKDNLTCATTVNALDSYDPDALVFDVSQRCKQYLPTRGITPVKYVSYNIACQQGWANAPTNDVQKAIWDKVHSVPDKPLTIKYNAKRDAGK